MKVCQMLVMIAGTITMASACAGGIVSASRPIDTVGKPRPITPLMKPASRNAAAIRSRRGSNIAPTLADPRQPHHPASQIRPSPMTKTDVARSTSNSHELGREQLHCRFMHARIAGCDNAAAALSGLAVPSGDDAAGAGDDRNQSRNVVGFQFGLDDEIEMAGSEHAVGIAIAAIARQPHALLD